MNWVTVREAAERYEVTEETIRNWVKSNRVSSMGSGTSLTISDEGMPAANPMKAHYGKPNAVVCLDDTGKIMIIPLEQDVSDLFNAVKDDSKIARGRDTLYKTNYICLGVEKC